MKSHLAADQVIEEPAYDVIFPFDGELCEVQATFVKQHTVLIGTRLLKAHRLTIDFPSRTLRIERTESGNGQLATDD